MGWTTTSWPCLTQLKTYVELCPATLTSISTLTLDRFGSRRPWADGCGSARLRSTLSVAIFGSLAAAAVMHARSSTETSPGWPGPLGLPVPPGLPVPASRARSSTEGSCATAIQASNENCRPLLRSEGHIAFVFKVNRASRIERVGIENFLILFATRAAGRLIAGRFDDPDRWSAGGRARADRWGRVDRRGRADRPRP